MNSTTNRPLARLLLTLALAGAVPACSEPNTPANAEKLSPAAKQWLDRAKSSYKAGDVDDARDAAQSALTAAPDSIEIKLMAARVHLARLDYAEAVRVLKDVQTTEARGLRGRAHWYADELDQAADDLDALLADPESKDEWAKAISKLARRGSARKPFSISGGMLAPMAMPRIRGTYLVVPLEIDGEQALAILATGKGEVVLDSAMRKEPSWVQLRFGERIEVRDVPALVEDLSGISKEVGAPIKALLGVNLLRRLNVTFDFGGEQFVVRAKEAAPPPKATRVPISYALGGAMVTRIALKSTGQAADLAPVLLNTLLPLPVALDDRGWKTAGVDLSTLQPQGPNLKVGRLPFLRIGAFDVPDVPGFYGPGFSEVQAATGMELQGALGSGLLAAFRCTFTDGGKALWMEDLPDIVIEMLKQDQMRMQQMQQQQQQNGPPGPGGPPSGPPGKGPEGAAPGGAPPAGPPPQPGGGASPLRSPQGDPGNRPPGAR